MKKFIIAALTVSVLFSLFSCAGKRSLTTEDPYSQASVRIILEDGSSKEGIVLKRDGDNLIYVDAKSHKKETLDYKYINKIVESENIYDFEGKPIPVSTIKENKKSSKTLMYGAGGFVLGAAVGTGVGIALYAANTDNALAANISIVVFAAGGAYYFGSIGSSRDFEDASFTVRKIRHEQGKTVKDEKIKKQIEEEKHKIEQQKKEKEELLKKVKKKDS